MLDDDYIIEVDFSKEQRPGIQHGFRRDRKRHRLVLTPMFQRAVRRWDRLQTAHARRRTTTGRQRPRGRRTRRTSSNRGSPDGLADSDLPKPGAARAATTELASPSIGRGHRSGGAGSHLEFGPGFAIPPSRAAVALAPRAGGAGSTSVRRGPS